LAHRSAQPITGFSERARQALGRYSWPGNIRELRNMIERATILASGAEIDLPDLPASLSISAAEGDDAVLGGEYSLDEIEAEHIKLVLARSKNLQQAAAILKLDPTTLLRKRKSLGLD
jgi:NtrC-family two-component system response regulator AlgB